VRGLQRNYGLVNGPPWWSSQLLRLLPFESGRLRFNPQCRHIVFFNWPTPTSFSFIFGLFKQTSSIRCRDSNPRPLERESLPITTRPELAILFYIKLPSVLLVLLRMPPLLSICGLTNFQ